MSVLDQLHGRSETNAKPKERRPATQGGHKRHGNKTKKRKGPNCTKFGFCRVSQGQNATKYRKILCNSGPTPPEARRDADNHPTAAQDREAPLRGRFKPNPTRQPLRSQSIKAELSRRFSRDDRRTATGFPFDFVLIISFI